MTQLLDQALNEVAKLSPAEQDAVATILFGVLKPAEAVPAEIVEVRAVGN